ncbi:copper transpport protein [Parahypoxylon ruwenzoriense]
MDHSHMDHGNMDHGDMGHGDMGHGDMGHGDMGHGDMPMCNMNMLFTWDTTDLCIVFKHWHIRGTPSLVFSLLAVIAICAGYEGLREVIRRYEISVTVRQDAALRRGSQADRRTQVVKAVLYAVQNFYAFMIMLLFMTYNGFVMLSVAIGAGLGYYFFGSHTKVVKETACH